MILKYNYKMNENLMYNPQKQNEEIMSFGL